MRAPAIALALMSSLPLLHPGSAGADEVIFLNGDHLSGKIVTASGGKLTIKTDAAGDVTVDLSKVKTFATDEPVQVGIGDRSPVSTRLGPGPDRKVEAAPAPDAPPQPIRIADINTINFPPRNWTGSIAVNGLLTTGNSETEQVGFKAGASKRWPHDRLSFGAEYSYGRQEDPETHEKITTIDYAMALAKYDHFFNGKLYGYLGTRRSATAWPTWSCG